MSRIARPWDDAQAENFTKTSKQEKVDGRSCRAIGEAEVGNRSIIDDRDNTRRLHSPLNCQAPAVAHHRLCRILCLEDVVQCQRFRQILTFGDDYRRVN